MKQKINRIRRRSGIVGILLLLILIMYVWIGFPKENRITAFDNEEVRYLQGSVYVSCNGEEIKTVLPGKITAKAGDTIVIRRKLDEDSVMGNTILFIWMRKGSGRILTEACHFPCWRAPIGV